ncbi:MAG: hypothetical protein JEZ00_16475 [Anaerolineaceae bacterium]|nr:hypothetical protein [Anaerolineaceae bacterium]
MKTTSLWLRFGILAGLLFAPYLLISVLPGSLYPVRFFHALDLIKLGNHHQDPMEQIAGINAYLEVIPTECLVYIQMGDLQILYEDEQAAIDSYHIAWQHGCLDETGMLNLAKIEAQIKHKALQDDLSLWLKAHPQAADELYLMLVEEYQTSDKLQEAADLANTWIRENPQQEAARNAYFKFAAFAPLEISREYALNITDNGEMLSGEAQQIASTLILSIGETDDVAYYRLGAAYSSFGEWQIAEHCFQESIALEAERTESWINLAITQKKQGKDSRKAIHEAESRVLDRDTVRSLMGIYWRDTDPEIAYVYWMKLIANQPQVPEWLIEAGSSLAHMGDPEAATALYQQAVDLYPDRVDLRAAFARFCLVYEIRISDLGLEQTRAMIRLEPDNGEGYLLEGQMLLHEEDYVTAERMLLQAAALGTQSAAAHYFLGILYQATDEPENARRYLELASQMADPYYQRAATRLLDSP